MELSQVEFKLAGPFTHKAAIAALMPSSVRYPGVYILESLDCEVFYIGSSSNLRHRFFEHKSELNSGRHPKKELIAKNLSCGLVYRFATFETVEEAIAAEHELLQAYGDLDGCLNVSNDAEKPWIRKDGSVHPNKGMKRSAEVCRRFSETRKGKYTGENSPLFGRTLSEETKKKISEAAKGRKLADEHREKFVQSRARGANNHKSRAIIIDGVDYVSVSEASLMLGLHAETIRHRVKSSNPKYTNWGFSVKGEV